MLFNIYLGSTIISYIVIPTFSCLFDQKLIKEGYLFKKKSILEKVTSFMKDIFILSFPGLNILTSMSVLLVDSDKLYENVKKVALKRGNIYLPETNNIFDEKIKDNISKDICNDAFIKGIQQTMRHVSELKYPGYETDLMKLYHQAEEYLKEKQAKKTTKASEVLSPDWFDPIVEIEAKLSKEADLKNDQSSIIESLKQMKELLEKEGIALQGQPSGEESRNSTPKLTL